MLMVYAAPAPTFTSHTTHFFSMLSYTHTHLFSHSRAGLKYEESTHVEMLTPRGTHTRLPGDSAKPKLGEARSARRSSQFTLLRETGDSIEDLGMLAGGCLDFLKSTRDKTRLIKNLIDDLGGELGDRRKSTFAGTRGYNAHKAGKVAAAKAAAERARREGEDGGEDENYVEDRTGMGGATPRSKGLSAALREEAADATLSAALG